MKATGLHAWASTANRGYVMQTGEIVITDTCERLMENAKIKKAYLGG